MIEDSGRYEDPRRAPREGYPETVARGIVVEREPISRSADDTHYERTRPVSTQTYVERRGAYDEATDVDPRYTGADGLWARTGHWRTTLAGALTACTVLMIMGLLGLGLALSQFNAATAATEGSLPASFGRNVGFWTMFSLLISFVAGGYVACRAERVRMPEYAAWRGAQVFLMASPILLMLILGGLVAESSVVVSMIAGLHIDPTTQAQVNPSAVGDAAGHLRDMTWLTLIGCVFGLLGSAAGGLLASPRVIPPTRRSR